MQATRQIILQVLHERGEATVDEIVSDLGPHKGSITAVTVRHHLNRLQNDGLVCSAKMRRKVSPGRPQHLYALTEQGATRLPNNYKQLAGELLHQMTQQLPETAVNVILDGMVEGMVREADLPQVALPDRLDAVVEYLNKHGYQAHWERIDEGFLLHTLNCPYHDLSLQNPTLCQLDMRLISRMLGIVPRLASHMAKGDKSCSYLIPDTRQMN